MKLKIAIIFCLIIFQSCQNNTPDNSELLDTNFYKVPIKYAKGFEIIEYNKYHKLTVFNPWQGANNIELKYYLIPENQKIPNDIQDEIVIKTPVRKVICLSTTHVGFIDFLDETNKITGLGGTDYIYHQTLRNSLDEGKIIDIGSEQSLNLELIIALKPDILFIYGISENITGKISELQKLGINVIIVSEYLESDPLGKAEWSKFFAVFFQKMELAEQKFKIIEEEYNKIKTITDTINSKPGILINIPYKGTWYIPGGNSYFAKIISDAGGNYLWSDNKSNESFPVNFETVFSKQSKATYLLNPNSANSISEILQIEPRLQNFNCIKQKNIYNHNARINSKGGNDFWESGVVNPHIILKDLVKIFHPEILKNYEFYYYRKI